MLNYIKQTLIHIALLVVILIIGLFLNEFLILNYYNYHDYRDIEPYLGTQVVSLEYIKNLLSYSLRILFNSFFLFILIGSILSDKANKNWFNNVRVILVLLFSLAILLQTLYTSYNIYFNVTIFLIVLNLIIKYKNLGKAFICFVRLLILCLVILILISIFQHSFETDYVLRILLISTTTVLCCIVSYKIGIKLSSDLKLLSNNLSGNNPIN